jgi:hypothetical protein
MPGIFPDNPTPVVHAVNGERVMMLCGAFEPFASRTG